MNYFPEQLCKLCKRPFSKHFKKGEPTNFFSDIINCQNWCWGVKHNLLKNGGSSMQDYFTPMDNLDTIEYLAKQKNLV